MRVPKTGRKYTEREQVVLSAQLWAAATYASARLPDERLNLRLVQTASLLAAKPQDSITQACQDWAAAKGAYRLVENDRVTLADLIEPLSVSTALRCADLPVVYAVQDTTTLNFNQLKSVPDLGPISHTETRGIFLHSTLALRRDGVPIGLLDMYMWCRDPNDRGRKHRRKQLPIEEKESRKWLQGVCAARSALEGVRPERRPRIVHVCDREGDVHEVFAEIVGGGDGAVIRCAQNRRVTTEEDERIGLAHEIVRQQPLLGTMSVKLPKTAKRPERDAVLELRACRQTLRPEASKHPLRGPVPLTLVEVREVGVPDEMAPLHWFLWTTEAAQTEAEVRNIAEIYALRWIVEEMHLVLKQGCNVEKLQFGTAERLMKAIALYGPIAVRIVQLTKLVRREPDAPCTIVLSEDEWRALWIYYGKPFPLREHGPPTLIEAVRLIGKLGGHLGRKGDGMPGVRVMWRGLRDLQLVTLTYCACRAAGVGISLR